MKYVSPSIEETAFNCPHCGALAKQYWYSLRADAKDSDNPLPIYIRVDDDRDFRDLENEEARRDLLEWFAKLKKGAPFFESGKQGNYSFQNLHNVNVSKCYNCDDIAIWIYNKLIYPQRGEAPPANRDLPEEIRRDYDEASTILDLSPRGAAALVRLCIQKLCKELGQPGKNINDDIAALVKAGLDSRIQKALDAVRVIGNNAVHPGSIDLRDDRATAESLFRLLNLIAEKMISEPKHVDEVYATLPSNALAAIEARDKKGK
jgi:hypothetical protein